MCEFSMATIFEKDMDDSELSYSIRHSWGDPREPEYSNDFLISTVTYKERDFCLFFNVYSIKDDEANEDKWILEVPRNIRRTLGKHWDERTLIFSRIIDHLEQVDCSYHLRGAKFSNIVIDASKVEAWLPIKINELNFRFLSITSKIPSRNTLPPLLIGWTIFLMHKFGYLTWLTEQVFLFLVILFGFATLIFLIKDIYHNIKFIEFIYTSCIFFVEGKHGWKKLIAKRVLESYGYRYLITFTLAVMLLILV